MPEEEKAGSDQPDQPINDEELMELLDKAKDPFEQAEKEPESVIDPDPDPDHDIEPPAKHQEAIAEVIDGVGQADGAVDIRAVYEKFNNIAETILNNYHNDREAIEDTIQRIRDIFIDSKTPREFIVEGLVSAHRTKAETNATIIKLLDSMSRMISAVKGTQIVQENVTNIDLSKLLGDDDGMDDDG